MSDAEHVVRLTRAQVREIDRRAIKEYHIPGIVLMENAARGVVPVVEEEIKNFYPETLVICGGGNNGGDGLALARHLHNRGVPVVVALTIDPDNYTGDALINWRIVRAMNLPCIEATYDSILLSQCLVVVDAIFGTGLTQPPRPPFGEIAEAVFVSGASVIAVDVPSGIDADTGLPISDDYMFAHRTVTFVAEKAGFANPAASRYLGRITVADIGCPRELIDVVRREVR